jgi:hypothetical protein
MSVFSGTDFVLTNETPTDNTSSTKSITMTNPTLTEDTTATKSIISDLSFQGGNKTFNSLNESMFYSKSIDLTCSIGGEATISYDLQANEANELPGWVDLDYDNKLLNFTTPSINIDTNYTFNIVATENATDYPQTIYLEVTNGPENA